MAAKQASEKNEISKGFRPRTATCENVPRQPGRGCLHRDRHMLAGVGDCNEIVGRQLS
jgi:hypothetical protein